LNLDLKCHCLLGQAAICGLCIIILSHTNARTIATDVDVCDYLYTLSFIDASLATLFTRILHRLCSEHVQFNLGQSGNVVI
jgi:hypothetical protein